MDYNPQGPTEFNQFRANLLSKQSVNTRLFEESLNYHHSLGESGYFYQHDYCGLPILQTPADILQLHSIIWQYKPSLIIETGIARGGSMMFYASQLYLLRSLGLLADDPLIIGIDILIHDYNKKAIEESEFSKYIKLIEGSSVNLKLFDQLSELTSTHEKKIIVLDSNHTYEHVSNELKLYSQLCQNGDYLLVFDTIVEILDERFPGGYKDRPWGQGNNPLIAVNDFLKTRKDFVRQDEIDNKLITGGAIGGWLKKI